MTKFNEKSLSHFALAFFFAAMQAFDNRMAEVESLLERLQTMRQELHRLFLAFDAAYKQSLKNQLSDTIKDKDDERDKIGTVMKGVALLWEKLKDDALNIHGRRVSQVFKDFDFRTTEALVAENAKIQNMEQRFAEAQLTADLQAMGLTELNQRFATLTGEIIALMSQRNEEQSTIVVGELKAAREALDAHYRSFITYLNAVQEIQPEEGISQAAQYYNQDLRKIEQQIAQSRKGGSVSQKPESDGGTTSGGSTSGGGSSDSGSGSSSGSGSGTGSITPGGGSSSGSGSSSGGGSTDNGGSNDEPGGDDH